jgi:O-Antigen ligase
VIFDSQSPLFGDIMRHVKRFGFPAVIPLAMLMSPARRLPRIRVAVIASLLLMVLIPRTPLMALLPISSNTVDLSGGAGGDARASGSLSNPNEYAYVSLLAAFVGLSHAVGMRGNRRSRRLWATLAVVAGLTGIVTSASRSGMAAALVAVAYILFHSKLSHLKKLGTVVVLAAAMLIGWRASAVYQDRMTTAMEERSQDANFAGRVKAQSDAFRAWLNYPFGVGFVNFATAINSETPATGGGSDSIYFDFLLATGAPGFLCIVFCFRNCWKMGDLRQVPVEMTYLKAGMIAAFVFGMASVSPASAFVAPFFFTLVGLAGCLGRDCAAQTACRT